MRPEAISGRAPVTWRPHTPWVCLFTSATMARVLVVGGGGREHTLAWKLAQSPRVTTVFVAGVVSQWEGKVLPPPADLPAASDTAGVAAWAKRNDISLVVVGPEQPLADGLADALQAADVACFGPSKAAARLETSKS